MGTPLGPKYIPYDYMDPLGLWGHCLETRRVTRALHGIKVFLVPS